jgi:hypothetical protein
MRSASAPTDRAKALLAVMNTSEKIAMLHGYSSPEFRGTRRLRVARFTSRHSLACRFTNMLGRGKIGFSQTEITDPNAARLQLLSSGSGSKRCRWLNGSR